MTDCSNPIVDHSRVKAGELRKVKAVRLRQDLASLTVLCKEAARQRLPVVERFGWQARASEDLKAVISAFQALKVDAGELDLSQTKLVPVGTCPISGIRHKGEDVHPHGVHMKQGKASTQRMLGGGKREGAEVAALLTVFEPEELIEPGCSLIYTRGTAQGMVARVNKQVSRQCRSLKFCPRPNQTSTSRKQAVCTSEHIQKLLSKLMPIREGSLPDWEGENLERLIGDTDVTARATAGAPYWRDKCEVHEVMVETVLPKVVDALINGTVPDLQLKDPELFLCELRNKLDRYEVAKLGDKIRPYFSMPYHWSILFSVLCQNFSEKLYLFHEKPDGSCANAYGLAWAHGGGEALREWASLTKYKEPRFYCYGDDTDFYWRDARGVLWRASPDFTQMDGSIDYDTVVETVNYIYNAFAKEHGHSAFWRRVCDWWIKFATNPDFLVDGDQVYRKPQVDGLATGVVGTTLFDTVKAVVSYSHLRDLVNYGALKTEDLGSPQKITAYFLEMGLEIKPGTWRPTIVREEPRAGELFADSKFLGVKLMYVDGPHHTQLVPYLDQEDWLKLILNPRNLHEDKKAPLDIGYLSKQRTLFDRTRGYLVTGGFSNERVANALYAILNRVDPVAINMEVRAGNGKGMAPEASLVLGEDFSYHDSEGVPTVKWCQNLYFTDSNQWEGDHWCYLFPTISDQLLAYKEGIKRDNPLLTSNVRSLSLVCAEVEEPMSTLSAGLTQRKPLKRESKPPVLKEYPATIPRPVKHTGSEADQLKAYFANAKPAEMPNKLLGIPHAQVEAHFGWTSARLMTVCQEAGYCWQGDWICCEYISMGTDQPELQAQIEVALSDATLVGKCSAGEKDLLARVPFKDPPPEDVVAAHTHVIWFPGAQEFLCALKTEMQDAGIAVSSPRTVLHDLGRLRMKGHPKDGVYLHPHQKQLRFDEQAYEAIYSLELVNDKDVAVHYVELFQIISPLRSSAGDRAKVLIYEALSSIPFLPSQPKATRVDATSKREKLLKALTLGKASDKSTFTMGPIRPPPEFRDWYEETERQHRYDTYRFETKVSEVDRDQLNAALASAVRSLDEDDERNFPLHVFLVEDEPATIKVISHYTFVERKKILDEAVRLADTLLESSSIVSLPFNYKIDRKPRKLRLEYQASRREVGSLHAPRAKSPSLPKPPDENNIAASKHAQPPKKEDGKRRRSSGTTGPQRAKKWKANKKKRESEARLSDDNHGRCPSGPSNAGEKLTAALSKA